jgi:hypothetical protein
MSRSLGNWLAVGVFAFWAALTVGGVVLLALTWGSPAGNLVESGPSTALGAVADGVFACVGLLLAIKLPRNAIGWVFLAIAITLTLSFVLPRYGIYALAHPGSLPGATVALSLAQAGWIWLISSMALLLLLFPDGALLSPRWRPVLVLAFAGAAVTWIGFITAPGPLQKPFEAHENPFGVEALRGVDRVLVFGWSLMIAAMFAGAGSMVHRYRRSKGIERQQVKLFTCAAVAFPLAAIAANVFESTPIVGGLANQLAGLTSVLLPVATAIAVLRYRLYDIDRIVSRTIVFGVLTVLLGGAYVGLVLVGQALFSSFAGGSHLAIAGSTLVVAALFLPLRARIQRIVDQRFNRRRYDAQRTLEAFGARLREQIDLETLRSDLGSVVEDTMQPRHVSLWLRREPAR